MNAPAIVHAVYIGRMPQLHGKGALLQDAGNDHVYAQFDDHAAEALDGTLLAFGWHVFEKACFKMDEAGQ